MRTRLLLTLLVLLASLPARAADPLVADLSKHLVAITTGFAGTDVLLFGAVGEDDADVVVVVRGPGADETIRRKARQVGIWVNSGRAQVVDAPSFYHVAATRPLEDVAPPAVLKRHEIGLDNLGLDIRRDDDGAGDEEYRQALIRLKQGKDLYVTQVADIGFLGNRLFRTELHFPANVPVGTYLVEVYMLQDGAVVSAQTTPLIVSKIGIGAEIYDFAHHQAAAYGIIAILLATLAGWAAAVAFRKG